MIKHGINSEKIKDKIPLILSFLLPFLAWSGLFVYYGIYPFGNEQAIIQDGWHQYFPFIKEFITKAENGSSLLWSWTNGGSDYLAQIAYYLTGPTNILTLILPHEYYREIVTWLIPVKMGLAALFMAGYLRKTSSSPTSLKWDAAFFSLLYATSGWVVGYYRNIIWIDTFVLLPPVMTGFHNMMHTNKWKMYVILLFLAVWSNFLMGLYVCIFLCLMFIVNCCQVKRTRKEHAVKLLKFGGYSAIAVALTGILTVPAYAALKSTISLRRVEFPQEIEIADSLYDVCSKFLIAAAPTELNGAANWNSGLICILLLSVFLLMKGIKIKEKVLLGGMLLLLVASTEINVLYYAWNGFNYTASMPGRFTFIFSFMLIHIAYTAHTNTMKQKLSKYEAVLLGTGVLLTGLFIIEMSLMSAQDQKLIMLTLLFVVLYLILFLLSRMPAKKATTSIASGLAAILIMAEAALAITAGSKEHSSTEWTDYPYKEEEVRELLKETRATANDFYRTEVTGWDNYGRNALYGINGYSWFSSTMDARVLTYLKSLGWHAALYNNKYAYKYSSPLNEMFFNMKYKITVDEAETGDNWEKLNQIEVLTADDNDSGADQKEEIILWQNQLYLPLGFMVNPNLSYYSTSENNPIAAQNNFYRLATGLDKDLFEIVEITDIMENGCIAYEVEPDLFHVVLDSYSTVGSVAYRFTLPVDGEYYLICTISEDEADEKVIITKNNATTESLSGNDMSYIRPLGEGKKGESIAVQINRSRDVSIVTICLAYINKEALEEGYELLTKEPLALTRITDTEIEGTITTEGGLLYTSIPHTKNWTAGVNGKEAKIETVGDCMIALTLEAGSHVIEFKYVNIDFMIGSVISLTAVQALVILIVLEQKQKRKIVRQQAPEKKESQ